MYYLFILLIGAERLVELVVSRRNAKWSFANGGKEFGRGHYPVMVGMHVALLVSCIAEVCGPAPAVHSRGWAGRCWRWSRSAPSSDGGACRCWASTGIRG